MLKINRSLCALPLLPAFADVIDAEVAETGTGLDFSCGCTLNFRDPNYSSDDGG